MRPLVTSMFWGRAAPARAPEEDMGMEVDSGDAPIS